MTFCCLILSAFIASCGLISESSDTPSAPRSSGVNSSETLAAINAPPGTGDRPLLPGQSGTQYMPNGLPALAPARGVNADTMFAEKISDDDARFKRLENAVADMRREFEALKPAIIRLSAVESDMQTLITQLQNLTGGAPAPSIPDTYDVQDLPATPPLPSEALESTDAITQPVAPVAAVPAPSPPSIRPLEPEPVPSPAPPVVPIATAAPPPAPMSTSPPLDDTAVAVTGIRSGEYQGYARLVLDVSGTAAYKLDMDDVEHVLTITLPSAALRAPVSGNFPKPPLLESWSATSEGGGSVILIQLKSKAVIAKESVLAGTNGAGKRIVIDLKEVP